MPFRDELEAARHRIDKLDRTLAAMRAERETATQKEPPFAIATVILAVIVLAMGAGMALLWNRLEAADEATANWRELEGQTGRELEETQARLDEARRASVAAPWPPQTERRGRAWARGGPDASEEWTGRVIERIGDAPAQLGEMCTFAIERTEATPHHYAPFQCRARVRCGDDDVYPRAAESNLVGCAFGPAGQMQSIGPAEASSLRLVGAAGDLRIDDGIVGTWSLRIADGAR